MESNVWSGRTRCFRQQSTLRILLKPDRTPVALLNLVCDRRRLIVDRYLDSVYGTHGRSRHALVGHALSHAPRPGANQSREGGAHPLWVRMRRRSSPFGTVDYARCRHELTGTIPRDTG